MQEVVLLQLLQVFKYEVCLDQLEFLISKYYGSIKTGNAMQSLNKVNQARIKVSPWKQFPIASDNYIF